MPSWLLPTHSTPYAGAFWLSPSKHACLLPTPCPGPQTQPPQWAPSFSQIFLALGRRMMAETGEEGKRRPRWRVTGSHLMSTQDGFLVIMVLTRMTLLISQLILLSTAWPPRARPTWASELDKPRAKTQLRRSGDLIAYRTCFLIWTMGLIMPDPWVG